MEVLARILLVALSLFLVPGTTIRLALFVHSLDNFDVLGAPKLREREVRCCRQLRLASRLLLVLSLLVMWFLPTERSWAFAALGLWIGYRGKYFIQAIALRHVEPNGTLDYYQGMLGTSLRG